MRRGSSVPEGVNRKRVQRLWREEGLRVPVKRRKRQRLGDSAVPAVRLRAERPSHVWALDFQFDQIADGRVLKLLNIVGEHTREALAVLAARSITADSTASTLDRIVAGHGTAPEYIRCDNGPELTANTLRDWCRFSGTGSSYIEPGAPWENPYVESFNGRLRDEFLAVEQFDSLLEAQVLIEDRRIEYNTTRPHSSLGWLSPAAYAEQWRAKQCESPGSIDQQTARSPGSMCHFAKVIEPPLRGSDHSGRRYGHHRLHPQRREQRWPTGRYTGWRSRKSFAAGRRGSASAASPAGWRLSRSDDPALHRRGRSGRPHTLTVPSRVRSSSPPWRR